MYKARSSKVAVACALVWIACLCVDVALAASPEARLLPLRHCGIYSLLWAMLFYAWRAQAAGDALQDCFLHVADQLEHWGCPAAKALLTRGARKTRRICLFYNYWGLTQVAGVTQTIFNTKDSAVDELLQRSRIASYFGLGLRLSHAVALLCGLLAFYSMMPVLFVLFRASSCLFRALALECESARWRGEAALRRLAALHALLTDGARRSRLLFVDMLAHLLAAVLVLPLTGTVEILAKPNDVDSLTIATFAAIGIIFVPLCLAGQEVEDASTALAGHLYAGPWLEEDGAGRRLRLKLMLGGGARARMAVGGLGSLNAKSCMLVVQRWFSYLNVFMSIQ